VEFLQNNTVLFSTDLDELREFVATQISPHDFAVNGDTSNLKARIAAAECAGLNLTHVSFGDVELNVKSPAIESDELLLFHVTNGTGIIEHGTSKFGFSPGKSFIRDLGTPIAGKEQNFGAFMVALSKGKLRNHARTLAGIDLDFIDLEFETEIDSETPGGKMVHHTINYLAKSLNGALSEQENPIISAQLEDMLLTQCLTLLPNSYKNAVNGSAPAMIVPYYIKRARDYIYAHVDQKVTLADIAAAAGCSYRGLQRGFLETYGVSPMTYLQTLRLKRIRAQLLSGTNGEKISDIAGKWGFPHMGRFAQLYCQQFGELPSETLRQHC